MAPLLLSLLWRRLTRPISLLKPFGLCLVSQVHNLTLPDNDELLLSDEWRRSEHVALPLPIYLHLMALYCRLMKRSFVS